MMAIKTFADGAVWNEALAKLPLDCRDVYFTPEYHHLHTVNGDGEAHCTAVTEEGSSLLVPGMRLPVISEKNTPKTAAYWDIQSCNGYGGPLVSPDVSPEFLKRAWETWRCDSAGSGVVAAF